MVSAAQTTIATTTSIKIWDDNGCTPPFFPWPPVKPKPGPRGPLY